MNMFPQLIFKFFVYCTIDLNPMKSSPTNPTHQRLSNRTNSTPNSFLKI
jgi:hypothetical protein